MPEENQKVTPDEQVKQLQSQLINSASDGVQTVSVDGMTVNRMTAADRKIALDEAKKNAVKTFPMVFFKWK